MPDALTADDLRRGASEARDNGYPEEADRLSAAADLMDDQGWRLTPPPQPTAQPLPPLSCGVTEPHEEHLHPVGKHDVEVWCCGVSTPQPGTAAVDVDDLRDYLSIAPFPRWRDARNGLAAALAEADRDR